MDTEARHKGDGGSAEFGEAMIGRASDGEDGWEGIFY